MYGLKSWELAGMNNFDLFFHRLTHGVDTITVTMSDGTTRYITSKRYQYTKVWLVGKHKLFRRSLFDYLNELLFSDYEGRSPIVSIVTRNPFRIEDVTDQYAELYKEFLEMEEVE